MPRISNLTSLATADNSDELAIVDVSAGVTKKITRGDLIKSPLPNNSVTTAAITDGSVTASKIATNAITLGYAQITSNFVTSSTTAVQIPGLSVNVTIPAGGRRIKITGYVGVSFNSNISTVTYSLWDGTVGSGTQIQLSQNLHAIAGNRLAINMVAVVSPSAGSKTYNLALTPDTGTETVTVNTTFPAFILVEAI